MSNRQSISEAVAAPTVVDALLERFEQKEQIVTVSLDGGIEIQFRLPKSYDEFISTKNSAQDFAAKFRPERLKGLPPTWRQFAPTNLEVAVQAKWLSDICQHPDLKEKPLEFLRLAAGSWQAFNLIVEQVNAASIVKRIQDDEDAIGEAKNESSGT